MTLKEEFQTRNFSMHLLDAIDLTPVRFANPAQASTDNGKLALTFAVSAFVILFIEVPLLLRICPTSSKFDEAIRKVSTNYMRAAAYAVMAVIQFLSTIASRTSLIAAGVFLLIAGIFYLLAAIKGQDFVGSKTLGGHGVAQMIV
ncbi:uncharacterized protein VDAG_01620 [Verticillium dahliae VdLs.17]|uniref:Golgi apparatus membrane protein TVP18 n=1 Tax=Verticillium dahliae (strain VdLs.17 / ATCC MYA-4575 / FGSC 10137) TaxID=498257 RepID=G2WSM4_VERDV|nr:uncharacterized protein VDAG_01620 [Verticillium dahliae VdLs.17]EGY17938.1 hypothetical protein VDAG_01620 [Verticillium dahliae VdLs.17]